MTSMRPFVPTPDFLEDWAGLRPATLATRAGGAVPLTGVKLTGHLADLLSSITLTQSYENTESKPIEAVYTFPLPSEAVILDVLGTIGDRELRGRVLPKQQAEEQYEDAVSEGDTAIMLERVSEGLYTMNVGNIGPHEKVDIAVTYAELYRWTGSSLRLRVPTTIAPRYASAPPDLEPHQVPEHTDAVRHPFQVDIKLTGAPARGTVTCPTHNAKITEENGGLRVHLDSRDAAMDRDFVLNVESTEDVRSFALSSTTGDGTVVLAGINHVFDISTDEAPRSVKIVIDCSGSMSGTSISQAREALLRILDELRPQDFFNIVLFGSQSKSLFERQVPADVRHLSDARLYANALDANMGGTEIGGALARTFALESPGGISSDVLLITDGEVCGEEGVVEQAKQSGHRIFTVGVGTAAVEELVRPLAEQTGGASEMVTPNEAMAERIQRHFQRIYAPRVKPSIVWPAEPALTAPASLRTLYAGDTAVVFGWLPGKIEDGELRLQLEYPDGHTESHGLELVPCDLAMGIAPDVLPRLGAAWRLKEIEDEQEATELAVEHQLMTQHTNYLVVDVRDEDKKLDGLPELRKVPQTMAAGWHGGPILHKSVRSEPIMDIYDSTVPITPLPLRNDVSFCLRSMSDVDDTSLGDQLDGATSAVDLLSRFTGRPKSVLRVRSIDQLLEMGLAGAIADSLRSLVEQGHDERLVVWVYLEKSCVAEGAPEYVSGVLAELRGAIGQETVSRELESEIAAMLLQQQAT